MIQQAELAHSENRLDETIELCRQALATSPDDIRALLVLGITSAKVNDPEAAISYLRRCAELDRSCLPAFTWLSYLLCELKRPTEALPFAEQAYRLQPNHPEVQQVLGICMLGGGHFEAARNCFDRALSQNRTSAGGHFGHYQASEGLGDWPMALKSLRRAVKYSGDPAWTFKLGMLELSMANVSKAQEIARAALQTDPNKARANHLMAKVLIAQGKYAEGEALLAKAAELDPNNIYVLQDLGTEMQISGRFDEAIAAFRHELQLNPNHGSAYLGIVTSKEISSEDRPLVQAMQAAAQSQLEPKERMMLNFALGKAAHELGQFEEAMDHFDEANRLASQIHFGGRTFELSGLREDIDRSSRLFTSEFMQEHSSGSDSDVPVFVVGMHRSGMTLVEQILTCHPKVGTAGETGFWAGQESTLVDFNARTLDRWALLATASAYLHAVFELAPGKERIVDKDPSNALFLGTIHLALPKAKIIHVTRDPLDTLVSIYATCLKNPPPFACDKENIVFAYEQYLRAMTHWRAVLSADSFLEVSYENLVANPQEQTQAIIDFIGLEWDEACATPQNNPRRLDVPSAWHLRQPINQRSVGKGKNYAPWFGPLANPLTDTDGSKNK